MTMSDTDHTQSLNWEDRRQAMPAGTDAESLRNTVILHLLWCMGSFLAGAVLVGMSYALFAFLRGGGSELTGNVLSVLPGLICDLLAGAVLSVLVARRSTSRILPRLIFYSFAAPGLMAVIFIGGASLRLLAQ